MGAGYRPPFPAKLWGRLWWIEADSREDAIVMVQWAQDADRHFRAVVPGWFKRTVTIRVHVPIVVG